MCVNVSNAARRTHDRTGGQVYFPASQDIAGHGSGGRTSRPANCEWAALLVATGPGALLGKNGGGATAKHGVLLPRVIPSAAPGFEEPAADRGAAFSEPSGELRESAPRSAAGSSNPGAALGMTRG